MENQNNHPHQIELNLKSEQREKCVICGQFTYMYARSNGRSFHLCDQHQTHEHFIHVTNTRK